MSFEAISNHYGKTLHGLISDDSLPLFEQELQKQILIYDLDPEGHVHATKNLVRGEFMTDYTSSIKLIINNRTLMNSQNAKFSLLANDKLFRKSVCCRNEGCYYSTDERKDLNQHSKICTSDQVITTHQSVYGNPELELEKAIRLKYLPDIARSYRQKMISVFDIETFEDRNVDAASTNNTNLEANHRLVSIALGGNVPGSQNTFLIRESSAPESEQKLICSFIDELGNRFLQYLFISSNHKSLNHILQMWRFIM